MIITNNKIPPQLMSINLNQFSHQGVDKDKQCIHFKPQQLFEIC